MAPKDQVNIATIPNKEVHRAMHSRPIEMAPLEQYHDTSDHWSAVIIPCVRRILDASRLLFHPKPSYQILRDPIAYGTLRVEQNYVKGPFLTSQNLKQFPFWWEKVDVLFEFRLFLHWY